MQGFQPGHPCFHNGFPGHKGGNKTRGKDRAPQCGFQPHHPPFYTSGAVPGHAPTYTGPPTMHQGHPNWQLDNYAFGKPEMRVHQLKGGRKARSKERQCLEALQNAEDEDLDAKCAKLSKRFPPGMVKRLRALHDIACKTEHKDFMNAQRMVSQILTHLDKEVGDDDPAAQPNGGVPRIELAPGAIGDVPLPGSVGGGAQRAPGEHVEPAGSPHTVNGSGNGHAKP